MDKKTSPKKGAKRPATRKASPKRGKSKVSPRKQSAKLQTKTKTKTTAEISGKEVRSS